MEKNISLENKQMIKEYIENAKNKIVENIDIETKSVKYVSTLKGSGRKDGDEELVRAYILTKLVNELNYSIENIEIEHKYTAGRPNTNTSRIDILVRDTNKDVFLFIEVKSPYEYMTIDKNKIIEEQLFKVAGMEKTEGHKVKYLVLYTLSFTKNKIVDECRIIDNEKFTTYSDWEKNLDYLTDMPEHYNSAKKIPYVKGSDKDLEKHYTYLILKYLQKDLHNVLWGGGGTDDNDIFSSLTNLILAKIQDEDEKRNGDEYDFQTKSFETLEQLYVRINNLYRRALKEKLNIVDKEELSKSYVVDTNKFSLPKVKYTVQEFENFSLTDAETTLKGRDLLGEFFEGIIRTGFKQTKGQFFTPYNIVEFMLWAIQADKLAIHNINSNKTLPYMIDPSAGSGTFLIEYMKFITKNMTCRFNNKLDTSKSVTNKLSEWFNNQEHGWAKEYIYGSELNFNLGTATKVNMILHGVSATNIFVGTQKGDGLLPFNEYTTSNDHNMLNKEFYDPIYEKTVNKQFDLILTNPPFSVSLDNETKNKVSKTFIFGGKKNSENLFIERYYQLLKENGRIAAILPESVFDTIENRYIRLFMYKYFNIKAIISLPQLTFEPFTSTKTSIIFAQKKSNKELTDWNNLWNEYVRKYNELKTRVENIKAVIISQKKTDRYPSIKNLTENEYKKILFEYLEMFIEKEDNELPIKDIFSKYKEQLDFLSRMDSDTKDTFGYANTWWVFEKVSKKLDYPIFMAHANNVGYKRTKKNEKKMENDLYRVDANNDVIVDDGIKETILDYMREIKW